ncbi:hypothetical protein ACFLWY_03275 [Chloroflexota bacterium]
MLRLGPAILKGSDANDSTIPVLVASAGVEVNASAGVRQPRAWWGRSVL